MVPLLLQSFCLRLHDSQLLHNGVVGAYVQYGYHLDARGFPEGVCKHAAGCIGFRGVLWDDATAGSGSGQRYGLYDTITINQL